MSAYDKVSSKSCNKDSNITRCILTSTIVSTQMNKAWLMRKKRKILKIGRGTLRRAMVRRERVEDPKKFELWTFSNRLPQKDKSLKSSIEDFWTNNTRIYPNQRDVVRRRIGIQNCDPHVKHFFGLNSNTIFYKIYWYVSSN